SWRPSCTWCCTWSDGRHPGRARREARATRRLEPDRCSEQRFEAIRLTAVALPFRRYLRRLFQYGPEHRVDGRRDVVAPAGVDHGAVKISRLRFSAAAAQVPPERRHLAAAGPAELRLEQHL